MQDHCRVLSSAKTELQLTSAAVFSVLHLPQDFCLLSSTNKVLILWVLFTGFRLGNVLHAIQATEQSIQATDLVPRLCLTLANLNRVVYYICDTVLWAKSVGLTSGINREKWQMWAARHYYYFLLLSLVRDLYEILLQMGQVARDRAERERSSQDPPKYSVANEESEWLQSFLLLLFQSLKRHPPLLLDTVKNLCDILIPLNQLGIYKSNLGVVGLGGLVSSLAGLITVVYPQLKLKAR